MVCNYVFRHLTHSRTLMSYASEKMEEHIARFVTKPVGARVIFSTEGPHKEVRCQLFGGDGFNLSAKASSASFYEAVDQTIRKLENQTRKHKEFLKRRQRKSTRHLIDPDLTPPKD